ncbi:hypothetical protein B2G71_09375 [Novosphingobium sp. PC22D]|uniref:phasin family protein n=1 Tax=Novosphingobium sp. PC22D TaxID=1962403 RepID=UPI000BEF3C23|nr:phasin family protein [Novosphingobium sp. PC22D]PEQ13029.1 hypothetical protein B2G71_09375 [Novosphingobium sp. PC22D]
MADENDSTKGDPVAGANEKAASAEPAKTAPKKPGRKPAAAGAAKPKAPARAKAAAPAAKGSDAKSDTETAKAGSAAPAAAPKKRRGRPPKSATVGRPAAKPVRAAAKSAPAKPPKPKAVAKPAKPASFVSASQPVKKTAPKTVAEVSSRAAEATTPNFSRKEHSIMDMSANFTNIQDTISEAQNKAKEAFEKTTGMFGEVTDFAKGNVEAMIESGKILSEGAQEMGSTLAAEGKTAFEAMSSDMKELASAKSPTDFIKLQGDMVRKNFDSAVAYGSKNSEAMLKLFSDAMAPLSGRVSMAVDKARQSTI